MLLLFTGAPIQIDWLKQSPRIAAILQCFLPGQSVGDALFNTLTAASPQDVPAARLPFTWPRNLDEVSIPSCPNQDYPTGVIFRSQIWAKLWGKVSLKAQVCSNLVQKSITGPLSCNGFLMNIKLHKNEAS